MEELPELHVTPKRWVARTERAVRICEMLFHSWVKLEDLHNYVSVVAYLRAVVVVAGHDRLPPIAHHHRPIRPP